MGSVFTVKEIDPASLRQVGDLSGQMFRVLIHAGYQELTVCGDVAHYAKDNIFLL
jgi:hypothetical protein